MAIQSNFPALKPSLLLDFANVEQLDPRITFARASTARYYDGKTTTKAEENLLLQSQDFTTTWTNSSTTDTADTTTAPDGTTTADTVTETTTSSPHLILQSGIAVVSGARYVFSVFMKKGAGGTAPNNMQLTWATAGFSNTTYANFDIQSGTVAATGAGAVSASIENAGNGWYRCILVADATSSGTSGFTIVFTDNNGAATRAPSYAGATTADVFVWGAQLEQRSAVTAYTPTTTQPITNYIPTLLTAQNNVARFDHNPTTGESLGLLIEESRTNLFTYSDDFANAAWAKTRSSITSNTIVAPDGTLTGDKLVEDTTANNTHLVSETAAFTTGTIYTLTVFAKAGERSAITLITDGIITPSGGARFNLTNGVASLATGSLVSFEMVARGNGWYRCSITATAISTAPASWQLRLDTGITSSYTGDGYSGVYIWQAQLEAGAFATSPIPTVAAQVTRSADAASMTGTNFSSWYRQDEGTLYSEGSVNVAAAYSGRLLSISDGTANNRIENFRQSDFQPVVIVVTSGTVQATFGRGPIWTTTANTKLIGTYKVNDFAASVDAGTVVTDTSGTVPLVSQANIGARADASSYLNGTIRKIAYYPRRLANSELQALTS
jgi:hypothetical protein